MFGLIMGMTVFSALSMQWAKQEMVRYQAEQAERSKAQAEDVAKAMDFAIRTEDAKNYSEDYTLERARTFSNSSGRTVGDQDFMLKAIRDDSRKAYGDSAHTVAIAGSDDTLVRSKIYRSDNAEELTQNAPGTTSQPVVLYDTSMARDQQVRTSNTRMESMAEQVYAFYAGHQRFPTDSEFTTLAGRFGVHDVWGQDFDYKVDTDGQTGTLSFTTPWNYTQTLNLSLKDDGDPSNANVSGTSVSQ
jgi:hypothetical protein